jgi:hypothetical protein
MLQTKEFFKAGKTLDKQHDRSIGYYVLNIKMAGESVEKSNVPRLMENVQMQGFRNRGPAPKGWGLS